MFGSDWPVQTLVTSYPVWAESLAALVGGDHDDIFRGTASRVYRLSP